jgi:Leucine-rich repeat (LRR) protein
MANKVSQAVKYCNLNSSSLGPTLDFSGDGVLEQLSAGSNGLTSVDLSNCTALIKAYLNGNSISSITVTGCAALQELELSTNSLTAIDIAGLSALIYVGATDNALPEAAVDDILAKLDTFGLSNGEVALSGGTNAIPSAAGLTSKANLEGKGWTVTVNA